MNVINKDLVLFFEQGLIKVKTKEDSEYSKKAEKIEELLFSGGLQKYVSQIAVLANGEIQKLKIKGFPGVSIDGNSERIQINGLGEIFKFTSNTPTGKIKELEANTDLIVKSIVDIYGEVLVNYGHNRDLLQKLVCKMVCEKGVKENFEVEYDFFNTKTQSLFIPDRTPFVSGGFYPSGTAFRVYFLGMNVPVFTEDKSSRVLEDKQYTEKEMESIAEAVVGRLTKRISEGIYSRVCYEVRNELRQKYSIENLDKLEFLKTEGTLSTDFKKIYVPVNVKFEDIKKIVSMLESLKTIEGEKSILQDVLCSSNKGKEKEIAVDDFLKNGGTIVANIKSDLENLWSAINSDKKVSVRDLSYGNVLKVKNYPSFELNGNKFSRIDYRYPGSKKELSIYYENDMKISGMRFFRCLRKHKKQ